MLHSKPSFRLSALLLLALSSLSSCQKDPAAPAAATDLVGTWRLTDRQCYCVPQSRLDETVTFTTTDFKFFKDGQLVAQGIYGRDLAPKCGTTAPVPSLHFISTAPATVRNTAYTLDGNRLVLDYSNSCVSDAPVDTYQRQP